MQTITEKNNRASLTFEMDPLIDNFFEKYEGNIDLIDLAQSKSNIVPIENCRPILLDILADDSIKLKGQDRWVVELTIGEPPPLTNECTIKFLPLNVWDIKINVQYADWIGKMNMLIQTKYLDILPHKFEEIVKIKIIWKNLEQQQT